MVKILYVGLILGLLSSLVFAGSCIPEGTEGGSNTTWFLLAFVVLFFVMMYFVMIRPQRARQKEHEHLVEELKRGDKVITAGGIYGQIETANDDNVILKIESGATIRIARRSVAGKQEQEEQIEFK